MADYLILIPLLPLIAAIINLLFGRKVTRNNAHWVSVPAVAVSWIVSLLVLRDIWDTDHAIEQKLFTWIPSGSFNVPVNLYADQLTAVMLLVVTSVGLLVHIYSIGYMNGDGGYYRFFAYLPLFVFSMLMLVLADNYMIVFFFWEAVGLCSYLLIGYYYKRRSAGNAAKKAFIVNRVGDLGFGLGVIMVFWTFGTVNFWGDQGVFARVGEFGQTTITVIALLLFTGAIGKSAQFPLHVWLPDAMEGPTPVSALIHAATMVTAGVYLIVRCNVLYQLAPHASEMVAIAGAITLFMAATIATVQEDIKRVLAWSTVSQIGYMIMAAGLGLYTGAMFHFLTHAFFKALMFLVAGIVIHALAGEQGIDRMGGLRRYLPVSWVLMGVGCLAIAGVPPFSGFFSKDEILARAWDAGDLGKVLSIVGLAGAVLTAFYMFRMFFRVFHGPEPEGGYDHEPHNPTIIMTLPVVILGVLAVVGGWIQIPTVNHGINTWLDPSLLADPGIEASHATEWRTIAMSLAAAVVGIGVAWMIFGAGGGRRRIEMADRFPALRRFLLDQWRFDPMIDDAVVAPGRDLGDTAVARFEPRGALGIASLGSGLATGAGRLVRASQNGMVRVSAFGVVLGVAIVAVAMILGR